MSPSTVDDEQRCKDGIRLTKQLRTVSQRNLSNLPKRLTKRDLDTMQDDFLDCYKIYMEMRNRLPLPRMIDEKGTTVAQLEQHEERLQTYLDSQDGRIVKWVRAWLHLLQEFRWLIMINDGLSDREQTNGPIHRNGRDVVASLGRGARKLASTGLQK